MTKRQVEVFVAGCPVCEPTLRLVREFACPDCEVTVRDVREAPTAAKASAYGVRAVPAVAVDGQLASCCTNAGPTREALVAAGVGQAV